MAAMQIEAGSPLAQSIQSAAQVKLIEAGWAPEENDETLAEYVTMMLVNGKDFQGVQAELGGELLGVGEDDPAVADFARWLFEQARALAGGQQQQQVQQVPDPGATTQEPQMQDEMQTQTMQDEAMGDDDNQAPADGVPSGPKAMRNGDGTSRGRGRGGRMLGQMNRNMDRSSDDPLRRIKGAASGAGRIDAHAGRPPRGPRGGATNVANGVQRMMNGRGGGAMGQMNPMMQQSGPMGSMDPNTQMQFMQMMEMQAQMMAQFMGGNGQPAQPGGFNQKPGRGGRAIADRINKRGGGKFQGKPRPDGEDGDTEMSMDKPLTDTDRKAPAETLCKFNHKCANPDCPFAHQSPANTRPGVSLDMSDTCAFGAACKNPKCLAVHPSPAQKYAFQASAKSEVDCKFFPNCTMPQCPFRHPQGQRPCRNGADCKVEGCPFAHSSIVCRYNPCTRPDCPYKHAEGQKRGRFEDKVWTANGDGGSHLAGGEPMVEGQTWKSDRFAELKANEGQAEELILPGHPAGGAAEGQQEGQQNGGVAPGGDAGQAGVPQVAS